MKRIAFLRPCGIFSTEVVRLFSGYFIRTINTNFFILFDKECHDTTQRNRVFTLRTNESMSSPTCSKYYSLLSFVNPKLKVSLSCASSDSLMNLCYYTPFCMNSHISMIQISHCFIFHRFIENIFSSLQRKYYVLFPGIGNSRLASVS